MTNRRVALLRWRAFFVFILFSLVFTVTASAQQKFSLTPGAIHKALASGQIEEAIASYEAQAREAEENASRGIAPEKHTPIAVHAYAQASMAARLNGQQQRAIIGHHI